MKKITKSLFAISLSTTIIFQSMAVISNGEEIYLDNSNPTYEATIEKDDFIDPLLNSINRPGNENSSEINSSYLRSNKLTASNPFSYPEVNTLGRVTANGLNVRELPSASSNILSTLNKGSVVQILSKENDWYKISYFYRKQVSSSKYDMVFKEAYVSAKYISTLNVKEKGIDVSEHNGKIDWNKVKASGIDYVIIRAGYGTSTIDILFKSHIEGAIKAGLKIGVYWFSYASSPEKAKIEAQKCLEVIKPYKNNISYPVFFDFEETSANWVKSNYNITVTKELGTSMAETFMDTIKSQGYTSGLYTGIPIQKYFSDELLDSSYTWLAQYSYRTSYPKQFSMWQYCEDCYVDGISGSVDINYTLGTKPVVVDKQSISSVSVANIGTETYTGSAIKPSITVKQNDIVLKENQDYTISYVNNIYIGTAQIIINGIGNYTGTKTVSFEILPEKVSNVYLIKKTINSLALSWDKIDNVTGYEIYKYNVDSNSYKLLENISNNSITSYTDVNLESATSYHYKIRAYYRESNGRYYYGMDSDNFIESTKVEPVQNLKLDNAANRTLKISWDKVDNAHGYKIYRYDVITKKYKLVNTINNNSITSYTDYNRVSAGIYYYKIKAYKYINGMNRHSDYSLRLKAITNPLKPNLSLRSTTAKSINLSWTNISKRATGYEMWMSTSKNGTYKSIGITENKSYTKRSLTRGKTYYFKVRAYRIVDGKKIYSSYSSVKSIKCK